MLPAVVPAAVAARKMISYTIVMVATSAVMLPVGHLGWIYGVTAVLAGAHVPRRLGAGWCSAPERRRPPCGCSASPSPTSPCSSAPSPSTSWSVTGCDLACLV